MMIVQLNTADMHHHDSVELNTADMHHDDSTT